MGRRAACSIRHTNCPAKSPDVATRAKASCELGWTLLPAGELAHAEELFQSGLHELPADPQFDPARVLCLIDGSEIAYRNGDAHEALLRTEAAERTFNQSLVRSPVEELNLLLALADGYATTGQFRESDAAFRRASARMSSLGYDDTQKAVKLFNDWGLMLSDAGRPLQAEDAYRRAIEIGRTNQTEDEVLPEILHNYSAVLRELGKLHEAQDYSERAHQKALLTGNQILANQSDLQRARIYRDEHEYDRAAAILAEVEPKMRSSLPPGHYALAVCQSDKSLLAEAQGNLTLAWQLANEAVVTDEASIKTGGQGAVYLPSFLVRRSNIELEVGKPDAAVADAAKAVSLLQDKMEPGTLSSSLGRAYLALARAFAAQGKREDARESSRAAFENLQFSVGATHPDTLSAKKLLS